MTRGSGFAGLTGDPGQAGPVRRLGPGVHNVPSSSLTSRTNELSAGLAEVLHVLKPSKPWRHIEIRVDRFALASAGLSSYTRRSKIRERSGSTKGALTTDRNGRRTDHHRNRLGSVGNIVEILVLDLHRDRSSGLWIRNHSHRA